MEKEVSTSVLKFKGYDVRKMSFETVDCSPEITEFKFKPIFLEDVKDCGNNCYEVTLSFKIGPSDEVKDCPFIIEIDMRGHFELEPSENDVENHSFIHKNTIAIMFPYLRAIVSNLTINANIPPLVLPIINIAESLNSNSK